MKSLMPHLKTFDVDHINGDRNDMRKENLQVGCKNVHIKTILDGDHDLSTKRLDKYFKSLYTTIMETLTELKKFDRPSDESFLYQT